MSDPLKARGAALGCVCRLVLAAERGGERSVSLAELNFALENVDVEALAFPRTPVVRNVGQPVAFSHVTTHTPQA